MTSTTAIRRFDDLRRIVIPEEVLSKLGITEGTPMKIFFDERENKIVLQKHNPYVGVLAHLARAIDELRMLSSERAYSLTEEEHKKAHDAANELCVIYHTVEKIVPRF